MTEFELGVVILYIISAMLIIVFTILILQYKNLLTAVKREKIEIQTYANEQKKLVDDKLNKFCAMSFQEFEQFLGHIFSLELELCSAINISENDPNAKEKLYATTLSKVIEYLGPDNVVAIERFYGAGYVSKWCMLRYKLLYNRGVVTSIIEKTLSGDRIQKQL